MQNEEQSAIERGMHLAATLPDIMPQQANERIKPIYDDIQQVLRVPIVNLIFRSLANYPDYLQSAWQQIRPLAGSRTFEQAADELRSLALLTPSLELPSQTSIPSDAERLRSFNDTIHYVLPKLLLIATALSKTPLEQAAKKPASTPSIDLTSVASGIAEGTGKVEMIDPSQADERVRALFESVKERHSHPLVSSYFRGLANWPDFLESAWSAIEPHIGGTEYEHRKHALIARAQLLSRNWPAVIVQIEPAAQMNIKAILAAFRLKFIPEMLMDAALIKSLLDGSAAARTSRFSMAS